MAWRWAWHGDGRGVVGVAWWGPVWWGWRGGGCDVAWRAHLPISGLIPCSLLAILKTISCFYSKEFA